MQPRESVAVTVKGNVPTTVGVPERMPVAPSNERPAGRAPAVTARVVAPTAPDTVNGVGAIATPAVAAGRVASTAMGLQTTIVRITVTSQPFASRYTISASKRPASVGVPSMRPLLVTARPGGRLRPSNVPEPESPETFRATVG